MIRRWFARHRSAALTSLSGGIVAVTVVTLALVYPGFEAQRLDLNDGAVWVVNGERQAVGRANCNTTREKSACSPV